MATYTIKKIQLPNGDICNIESEAYGVEQSLTIAANGWTGNGPYTYTASVSGVTSSSVVECYFDSTIDYFADDITVTSGTDTVTFTTSVKPSSSVNVTIKVGTSVVEVYSKSEAVAKADIVNNLTSTSTTAPLSAAQGKVLNDGKVAKKGDTMTGALNLTPSGSEGGEIHLNASTDHPEHSGIAIDQQGPGVLRVFGLPSADGTTRTGNGTALFIDPYLKKITGGYTFTGNVTGTASGNLTSADVVNNLTSTSTTAPLSAAQGKALNEKFKNTTISVAFTNGKHEHEFDSGIKIVSAYRFGGDQGLAGVTFGQVNGTGTKWNFYMTYPNGTLYSGTQTVGIWYIVL